MYGIYTLYIIVSLFFWRKCCYVKLSNANNCGNTQLTLPILPVEPVCRGVMFMDMLPIIIFLLLFRNRYSADANALIHSCSCCQEMTTSKKEVTLTCADGSNSIHSYIYIESCGCKASDCPGQSLRRRRRRV